jgi:hypothetical protein
MVEFTKYRNLYLQNILNANNQHTVNDHSIILIDDEYMVGDYEIIEYIDSGVWKRSTTLQTLDDTKKKEESKLITTYGQTISKWKNNLTGNNAANALSNIKNSILHIDIRNQNLNMKAVIDKNNNLLVKIGNNKNSWNLNPVIYKVVATIEKHPTTGKLMAIGCIAKLSLFTESKVASTKRLDKVRTSKVVVDWIRKVVKIDFEQGKFNLSNEMDNVLCCICTDNFADHMGFACANQNSLCRHKFCKICWTKSLELNKKCPLCRAKIETIGHVENSDDFSKSEVKKAFSIYYNKSFVYNVGKVLSEPDFNTDLNDPCSKGLHGFLRLDDKDVMTYLGLIMDSKFIDTVPQTTIEKILAVDENNQNDEEKEKEKVDEKEDEKIGEDVDNFEAMLKLADEPDLESESQPGIPANVEISQTNDIEMKIMSKSKNSSDIIEIDDDF